MIEKIAIFIVFLTPLIFFHELGHFFFARLFGVRVEVFSIGFGPKIAKFKKWGTEFAVSIIPLGGYVKMYGDDMLNPDSVPEENRHEAFTHKGKWARFWIVFGGPLANFILAYWITFGLLLTGERVPEPQFGFVAPESRFFTFGVRTGDKILKLNDKEILGLADMSLEASGGEVKNLVVNRQNKEEKIVFNLDAKSFFEEFVTISQRQRLPAIVDKEGKLFALSNSEDGIDWETPLDSFFLLKGTQSLFLHPIKENSENTESYVQRDGEVKTLHLQLDGEYSQFIDLLKEKNYFPADLQVSSILLDAPAEKAGLKKNDIIYGLNDRKLFGFLHLSSQLQSIRPETPVTLKLMREGQPLEIKLTPAVQYKDEQAVKTIGVYSAGKFQPVHFIQSRSKGVFESLSVAVSKTLASMWQTLLGYKKLITFEFSRNNIGGPIAIAKVAADSFNISLSYFFKLMALISVNLGIINLFPIPVLDGGHILFILIELVNGGPVSKRKLEVAQQFGVSLLFLLIFAALFNDISRFF